ncbi:MAG: type II secretion system F family protein [Candidatus Riflebacteria bacterium]|nr:type II secretion system F family protein [Candidatus Riflebacteria bacterium]
MSEIRSFFIQMETTIGAGIDLKKALSLVGQNLKDNYLKRKVKEMERHIDNGSTFSEAMRKVGDPFNEMHISFISFGEESGSLDKVFSSLAKHSERELGIKREVINSLLYPLFVLMVAMVIGPIVRSVSTGFEITQIIWQVVSNLLLFVCCSGFIYLFASLFSGEQAGGLLIKIPVIGVVFHNFALARFTRALAISQTAGVPIIQGITTAINVSGNAWLKNQLKDLPRHIEEGSGIATGLESCQGIPNTLKEMILVGEQSGRLDEMLEKTASYYEEEAEQRLRMVMNLLPAIAFLAVAGYVASIIIPTFQNMLSTRTLGIFDK